MRVLCGRDGKAVKEAAGRLGWEEAATDWREVVNRKDIDLVDVSTPGDSHAEIAIAAARAGKAVLCEKPLANTVRDAERPCSRRSRRPGVVHMVCHNYRRAPAVRLAKQMIEAGEIGEIYHYRGTYLQDWIVDPNLPLLWRFQKEKAGSGALGDIASHSVDLARFLVGEITERHGRPRDLHQEAPARRQPDRKKGKVTVDDASAALVRFANGAMGTIEGTRLAPGRKNYNRFEINGSEGQRGLRPRAHERARALSHGRPRGPPRLPHDPRHRARLAPLRASPGGPRATSSGTSTPSSTRSTTSSRRWPTAAASEPDFEDGVRNQKVLDAWTRSARKRHWEKVER